ncbi:ectonucleotide pyrophosphatase/phosphodiesterase family member 7-like [Strongylocentrotus purpuratus]|uniref:Uncharacterized protein n=1 Tax=Strongylocentrotus purpuratus TaxID=7668 RepID=A0A7M7SXX7_STRPU|nr:ectonucleotide pyrophosphatase/phosphodiesterase family member 7-like [Strongylocentrotus purpuratus]
MIAIGSDREEAVEDDEEEEEEPSRRQFDSVEDEVTGKLRKEKYDFDATTEQILVDFFGEHDCFYDTGSNRYDNSKFKKHMMELQLQQKVILLLADGLRWDSYGLDLTNLKEVERNGVKASWMNGVFISMSTPSMYSIATGLYPESHGAIHNLYFDPVTKNRTYSYPEALNITEWFDTGAEPVWVTAIMQGLHAGTILYPGGNVPIKGISPDKNIPSTEWFW